MVAGVFDEPFGPRAENHPIEPNNDRSPNGLHHLYRHRGRELMAAGASASGYGGIAMASARLTAPGASRDPAGWPSG
jgi:hypothetical protein